MKIELQKAGKKYFREWIFRNVDICLEPGEKVAVLGPNGSGKSTFLQLLSGALLSTEGSVIFSRKGEVINSESVFRNVCIAAPYLELIEEFTLKEIIDFHFSFKKSVNGFKSDDILQISGLEASRNKVFKYFSSGMKQRVKLSLALLSDVEIVLLDEPCSNLDATAINWYKDLVRDYGMERLIVVCSNNQLDEFAYCSRKMNMLDWK